ncbi:MAG: DUF378 domain-containing protein [Planctomycetota bacterium]
MGLILRICGFITVFGAVNWVVLSLFSTDAVRPLVGDQQTVVTHTVMGVVGLSALYLLLQVARPKKKAL